MEDIEIGFTAIKGGENLGGEEGEALRGVGDGLGGGGGGGGGRERGVDCFAGVSKLFKGGETTFLG